ncbi:MAG: PAS domain S-box protein, partial [Desulfosalsimonadaceae bacterium]|nr:PAS domain S-box protein [Desulfosalsimonadaceae bacterium]
MSLKTNRFRNKDRNQAEKFLRESEEKYRTLFEESFDGLFITSPSGKILEMNKKGIRMFGYDTKEEILSLDLERDVYAYPVDRKRILDMVNELGTAEYEVVVKKKSGEHMVTYCSLTAVKDKLGGITAYRGIIRDITDLKRAEEELRRSEARQTLLNRIANVFLTVPDEEMFGQALAVVLGAMKSRFGVFGFIEENGELVIPSMTREIWRECQVPDKSIVFPSFAWGTSLWGRAIREQQTFCSHGPFHTPAGHIHIDNFCATPIVFRDKTIGLLSVANRERGYSEADKDLLESIATYISPILNARLQRDRQEKERNRAEEALRKREKDLKEAQRLARIGSWDWDATTDTISWSEEYYHIYGFDPARRPPGYVDHLKAYTPESSARLDAAVKINMETGEPYELDLELAHTEGAPRWITARSETKRDAQGRIIGLRGTAQDITELKRAETELRASEAKMRSILDNVGIGVA